MWFTTTAAGKLLPGPVGDGPDNAGNGDLHGAQKRKDRADDQNEVGDQVSAEPAQEHSQSAAENAAGAALQSTGVEIRDHG